MRMRNSALLHGFWLTLASAFVLPGEALAGWGADNWGALMWNEIVSPPLLPTLGIVGLTLLAMGLAATAAWTLRKRRPALGVTLALVLLAIPLAVAAGTLTVPNTFVNGTMADADQVNALDPGTERSIRSRAACIDAVSHHGHRFVAGAVGGIHPGTADLPDRRHARPRARLRDREGSADLSRATAARMPTPLRFQRRDEPP